MDGIVCIVDEDESFEEALFNHLRANGKGVRRFTSGRDVSECERNDNRIHCASVPR